MKLKLFLGAILCAFLISSCSKDEDVLTPDMNEPDPDGFELFISPVMSTSCSITGCHSGSSPAAGIGLTTYNGVKGIADSGRLVGSTFWEDGFSRMPKNGNQLDQSILDKIKAWVDAGAMNN
ncbi:MAG: hypothetical protein V3V00_16625 [Saprospiraceae bacterium]